MSGRLPCERCGLPCPRRYRDRGQWVCGPCLEGWGDRPLLRLAHGNPCSELPQEDAS